MKKAVGYIVTLALIVIFALFCSGRVGWFLLLAAFFCPLFSLLFSLIVKNKIEITVDVKELIVEKRNQCNLLISVKNHSFLPSPAVHIELIDNSHFTIFNPEKNRMNTAVFVNANSSLDYTTTFEATICGGSYLGVKKAYIHDYLGIIRFKIKEESINNRLWKMGVLPVIADINPNDEIINQSLLAKAKDNDSDDTLEQSSDIFGGFPGFDYREYQPGDPLKRINSKLSAKTDKLMVRLDEKNVISTIAIMLSPCIENAETSKLAFLVQNTIESALGYARHFILHDYAVIFYVWGEFGFEEYPLNDENDLYNLCTYLANYIFISEDDFESGYISDNLNVPSLIYCTPTYSESVFTTVNKYFSDIEKLCLFIGETGEGRTIR